MNDFETRRFPAVRVMCNPFSSAASGYDTRLGDGRTQLNYAQGEERAEIEQNSGHSAQSDELCSPQPARPP